MALLIFTDNYPPQSGGIGTYADGLARNLYEEGIEVIVFAPGIKGDREWDLREKFITYRLVAKRPVFEFHALLMLFYLTLRGRVDRVLCMTWYPCGSLAILTNFLFNVPYYVVVHGGELLESEGGLLDRLIYGWILRPLKRLVLGRASILFTNSNYTKRLPMALGVDEKKIVLVPGGTDPEKFHPVSNRGETARRYGLEGKKVLLTVARLEPHKGLDTVISLMPELVKKIPNLVYVVVGTGRQEATLKDMVGRLNLEGRVLFIGFRPGEELPGLYSVCDVFVMVSKELPSEFEGFGVAFLEANACGKPVIGGRSGGIPEAVVHGETGLLADPNNPQEIFEAIVRLLTDDFYAKRLGERGRQRVVEEFNWRATARRVKNTIYTTRKG
ncbi:MAG TPA: glycosyltransferase family 4 protein [Candidatus Tripitaka californicus]|uniref:glycosyltransferase family 4 protein n=1 Tax=Candidatus Tripitaka californicus TaxID=3367616 RepID=UPI004029E14B|nr:glycosyltransferase family 4 protein [Planctomycetota bacterium]